MVLMPPSMPALLLLLVGWYTIGLTAATTRQQPATLLIRADGAAAPLPLSGASWTISSDTLSELGTLPATVPGDLISDLQRAAAVPDPWFETNFLDNRSVWNAPDWSYSRTFTGPAAAAFSADGTAAAEAVLLVLDSVKMGAQVVLNGATVGETTDQFLRYEFDVTALLHRGGPNHLQLIFDSTIGTDGRFMACTGGWDWAPWSHTWDEVGAPTFSKGIVGDVYLLPVRAVALQHFVPHVFYLGEHPTQPLLDGAHAGFEVRVRLHLRVVAPVRGAWTVRGSWSESATVTKVVRLTPAASGEDTVVSLALGANASDVQLWWPNQMGPQRLYNITATFTPEGASVPTVSDTRRIGFSHISLVTANDTDPAVVSAGGDGSASPTFTTLIRVNGARIYARGANMVPADELEARVTDLALRRMVASAASANMNMIRVWGGGTYLPQSFYDATDELGILVYHDMMYAQEGHSPCCPWYGPCWYGRCDLPEAAWNASSEVCNCDNQAGRTQRKELQHQIRRLSHHTSIAIWDATNEALGYGLFASFVMTTVAAEDASRVVWPASPSQGWSSGVHRLSGLPNGKPLVNLPHCPAAETGCDHCGCEGTRELHGPYSGDTGWGTGGLPVDTGHFPPAMAAAMNANCGNTTTAPPCPPGRFKPHPVPELQVHPYSFTGAQPPPLAFAQVSAGAPGYFVSEFGVTSMASYELMSPAFSPEHWGVHTLPWRFRSHSTDSMALSYFGASDVLDHVGELPLKNALYMSMLAQALFYKSQIEGWRSTNLHGSLTWDLGEVWQTAGWGSLEYGAKGVAGAVEGGRWKPSHYVLKQVFADVIVACGWLTGDPEATENAFSCYIKNDGIAAVATARISIELWHLSGSGREASRWRTPLGEMSAPLQSVGATPATAEDFGLVWFCPTGERLRGGAGCSVPVSEILEQHGCARNGTDCVLNISVTDRHGGAILAENTVVLANPTEIDCGPSSVEATVLPPAVDANGRLEIKVASDESAACWVVLTTKAEGRFSENGFFVLPDQPRTVEYIPFEGGDLAPAQQEGGGGGHNVLAETLRVEHLYPVMHPPK